MSSDDPVDDSIRSDASAQMSWFKEWATLRAGPPEDPRAAAYHPTIRLIETILETEVLEARSQAVIDEFRRRREEILSLAEQGQTLEEQFEAMHPTGPLSIYRRLNLQKGKQHKGPDDIGLLNEYERTIVPKVKTALRNPKSRREAAARLDESFEWLTADEALEAAHLKPSHAAFLVLASRHGLSASHVSKRLTAARQKIASFPQD